MDFEEILTEQIYSYIGTNKMNFAGTVTENFSINKVDVYYYIEKNGNKVTTEDIQLMSKMSNVINSPFSGQFRIGTELANGNYRLVVYATDQIGLTTTQSVNFEVANPTNKPSVNITINPQPTGKWEKDFIDTYITDSGDFDLLTTAVKTYEITNSPQFPVSLMNDLPLDRKITINQIGVNYLHVQYTLEDGTKISSTAGPYLIDTGSVGDFEVKLFDTVGNEVNEWTNQNLELFISDPSSASISGYEKQYRIENYHTEWQTYLPGATIKVEGNNRIFARIISKSGITSDQKFKIAMIDKAPPTVNGVTLEITNENTYRVNISGTDSLSGVKENILNDGKKLNSSNSRYSIGNLTSKPSSVDIYDIAGNDLPNISFAEEPIVTFESPYTPETDVYRKDVKASIAGSADISYKLGNGIHGCTTTPCSVVIKINGLFSAIQTDGFKQTVKEIQIDNIDKSKLNLLLNGERQLVAPKVIDFQWNYSLSTGLLTCMENGVKQTYPISGTAFTLNGKNYVYDCYIEASYGSENLKSNRVVIYPDSSISLEGETNVLEREFNENTNIYIDEGKIGTSYLINVKANNFKLDKFPFPENEITKN